MWLILTRVVHDVIVWEWEWQRGSGIYVAPSGLGFEVGFRPGLYSPDFNPIEKMWSKIKAYLRKVKARTKETLWEAIGAALKTVTASDALGWFESCGYIRP